MLRRCRGLRADDNTVSPCDNARCTRGAFVDAKRFRFERKLSRIRYKLKWRDVFFLADLYIRILSWDSTAKPGSFPRLECILSSFGRSTHHSCQKDFCLKRVDSGSVWREVGVQPGGLTRIHRYRALHSIPKQDCRCCMSSPRVVLL